MAYSLSWEDDPRTFIRNLANLSREGRVRLFTAVDLNLREEGDRHIQSAPRLAPGSDLFWFTLILRDGDLRFFRFLVSDAGAPYGMLQIVFADEGD